MEEFVAPSFSLGFDLDLDPPIEGKKVVVEEEEPSCSECTTNSSFKRLRRGAGPSTPIFRPSPLDDEIEEFSSQEDCVIQHFAGELPSRQINSACSSSKIPLHTQHILSTINGKSSKPQNMTPTPTSKIPTSVEASSNKRVFPRLTLSPLRRIHLLDSDSDSLSFDDDDSRPRKSPVKTSCPTEILSLKTPAFDQYCKDYFQSLKESTSSSTVTATAKTPSSMSRTSLGATTSSAAAMMASRFETQDEKAPWKQVKTPVSVASKLSARTLSTSTAMMSPRSEPQEDEPIWKQVETPSSFAAMPSSSSETRDHQQPWNRYFFHEDVRVQNLVRRRLPHFAPIGASRNEEAFDYMGQFGQKKVPETTTRASPVNKKKEKIVKVSDSNTKRLASASSSGGHWYTGQDGKKVYVTKTGQEMSGRIAYMRYKKESGKTRKKGRKTSGSKKKKSKASGSSKKKSKK